MTMNDNSPMLLPDGYQPAPAPKKKAWFKKPLILLPAAALLLGLGIGTASAPAAETVEVIKEVPGPERPVPGPERIVTKEVKVPTTPASCKEYIGLSEEAFDISSEAIGQAAKLNAAGIDAQTAKLKAIAPDMIAAKNACRAS